MTQSSISASGGRDYAAGVDGTTGGRARRSRPWLLAAALLGAGALLASCGTDAPAVTYDCCINGNEYYVCTSQLAAGQCQSSNQTSGCTLQFGRACPAPTGVVR